MHHRLDVTLDFMRHGESISNTLTDRVGRADAPLTERGERQARYVAATFVERKVPYDRIYSSTLPRARATAEIIQRKYHLALGREIPLETDERLIEWRHDDWDGKLIADVYTTEVREKIRRYGIDFRPPNGESDRMVEQRMGKWLYGSIECNPLWHDTGRRMRALVVTHGNALRSLVRYILKIDWKFLHAITIDNASLTTLRYTRNIQSRWQLERLNDVAALKELHIPTPEPLF